MAAFYTWQGCNLFCSSDPTNTKKLVIEEAKLPDLEEMYTDHHAGGSAMQIEVATGFKKLEPTFKLKGFDPDLLAQFGLGSPGSRTFTFLQAWRDKVTGLAVDNQAVIRGRLGKITPDASKRGDFMGHDYAINEITFYKLSFAGQERVFFDFFSQVWRIGGVDQNADINAILGG